MPNLASPSPKWIALSYLSLEFLTSKPRPTSTYQLQALRSINLSSSESIGGDQ